MLQGYKHLASLNVTFRNSRALPLTRACIFNYLKPSGFFTYHQVEHSKILNGTRLALSVFVRISEQTATFVLYIMK